VTSEASNEDDPVATQSDVQMVARTSIAEGSVLAGRYRVQCLIGEGGMGDVYLATHLKIDKPVAVKVLAPEQMRRPRTVSRFLQEAKAASRIRHPHVVDITDFGESDGCAFFVMEYLEGEDLQRLLKREGRLPWLRARRIAIQLIDALAAAHAAGVIHRDIKPHNIFITPRDGDRDFVKVIDFGIAKLRDNSEEQLTRTGAIMGTAEYMSPEQGMGGELDGRSDLYSVGVILYRMLTGDVPFHGGNPMAVLYQHIHGDLVPPSEACPEAELGPEVDALVARALAKDRERRFGSAEAFIEALREIDDPAASRATLDARRRRSRWQLGVIAAIGALVVASIAWVLTMPAASDPSAIAAAEPEPAVVGEDTETSRAAARERDPTAPARPPAPAPAPEAEPAPAPEPEQAEPPSPERANALVPPPPAAMATDEPPSPDAALPNKRSSRAIAQALARVAHEVSACGKGAGLFPGEKVGVSIKIGPNGRVTKVQVDGAHSQSGKRCIAGAVERARFGEAARAQSVKHTFSI
jgi:eukaryotic-like serine/threonine-protein kinase